ncbi:MAG: type I-E CRISPR-associated protein Cse2/CasB [Thermoleophilia bacterium]
MSAQETSERTGSVEEAFFRRLGDLGRGELAVLRRNAGSTLAESRNALGILYRLLPPAFSGGRDEEIFFLAAALFAVNPIPGRGDFGVTMRAVDRARGGGSLSAEVSEGPIDRRMRILLDSQFERVDGRPGGGELAYRLRQCVRLAAGADIGIDGPLLLRDLRRWGHPDRYVQKRWARSYFAAATTEEGKDTEEAPDAA